LLDEVGLAQGAAGVENLVADRAGGHQTLARDQQTGRIDLVAGDQDGRAVAPGLVLDAGLIQRLGDRRGFLQVEVGIEELVGLLADHKDDRGDHGDRAGADANQRRQPADTEPLNRVQKLIQLGPSLDTGRSGPKHAVARQDLPSSR
jgi:hypothetical protein